MTSAAAAMSVCTKCGEEKGADAFNIRKDRGQPYRQCRDCMNSRKWHKRNPNRQRELNRSWVDRNRERAREIWREMAGRKRANPVYRLHGRISNQIWQVLRGRKNCRSAFSLVGYSPDELKEHIERQFVNGMSWSNMDQWHIDHIVPLSTFSVSGPDCQELRRAWALSNLRPLWAEENMRKGAKLEVLL